MKKSYLSLLAIFFACTSLASLEPDDELAIREIVQNFTNTWNYHAGQGLGDYYDDNADFVTMSGTAISGKQAIEAWHIQILKTRLKGSIFQVLDLRIREAAEGAVIAQVYWELDIFQKPGDPSQLIVLKGIFTHTILNVLGAWAIHATQNTQIPCN